MQIVIEYIRTPDNTALRLYTEEERKLLQNQAKDLTTEAKANGYDPGQAPEPGAEVDANAIRNWMRAKMIEEQLDTDKAARKKAKTVHKAIFEIGHASFSTKRKALARVRELKQESGNVLDFRQWDPIEKQMLYDQAAYDTMSPTAANGWDSAEPLPIMFEELLAQKCYEALFSDLTEDEKRFLAG